MDKLPNNVPRGILFDLDGTLLDTAPDLAAALNYARQKYGLNKLALEDIRPLVSHGSHALTALGCPSPKQSERAEEFRQALLDYYAQNVAVGTTLFDGMDVVLQTLEAQLIPWGIVTNKPEYLTGSLLDRMNLSERCAVVISGDTIDEKKPHPAPLKLAAKRIGVDPHACIYVGDAERDVIAGNAAGMQTLVATYGYISADEEPTQWGADGVIGEPIEVTRWLPTR